MGKTFRKWMWCNHDDEPSVVSDGSREAKFHRSYRKHEKDCLITSLQGDLIRTRNAGKEALRNAGFKTSVRMNHAKVSSSWRRPRQVFPLSNEGYPIHPHDMDLF